MTYASRSPYLSISTDHGTRRPSPRRVPGLPYAPRRVPGLPYAPGQGNADGLGGMGGAAPVLGIVLGGALILGLGYLMIRQSNAEAAVRAKLVEKEGAAGLAKYEEAQMRRRAGEQGLNLLSSWLSPPMRRNRRRRRRTSRFHDDE